MSELVAGGGNHVPGADAWRIPAFDREGLRNAYIVLRSQGETHASATGALRDLMFGQLMPNPVIADRYTLYVEAIEEMCGPFSDTNQAAWHQEDQTREWPHYPMLPG